MPHARNDLLAAHNAITSDLVEALFALGESRATEHQARIHAYTASQSETVSGRDRDAQIASWNFQSDALRTECLVRALEARLINVRVQLDHLNDELDRDA